MDSAASRRRAIAHARRVLIEAAKAYRHQLPKPICDIAWRAQVRLCGRYRRLLAHGKRTRPFRLGRLGQYRTLGQTITR